MNRQWTFANWIAYAVAAFAVVVGIIVAFVFHGGVIVLLIFLAAAAVAVMRQVGRRGR